MVNYQAYWIATQKKLKELRQQQQTKQPKKELRQ